MGRSAEHVTVEVWGRRVRLAYAVQGWKRAARQLGKTWTQVRRALLVRGTGPVPLILDGQDVTIEIPVCWGMVRFGGGRL